MTVDEAREALLDAWQMEYRMTKDDRVAAIDALIAAVRAERPTSCPGCGHHWWTVGDDAYGCESAETLRALREAAGALVRAYDANVDALNGLGHEGEPHNRDLWQRMPGDVQIYDQVGDCSACGGAQYGSESDVQDAIVAVKEALGEPLRPYEEHRSALAATPAEDGRPADENDEERLRAAGAWDEDGTGR